MKIHPRRLLGLALTIGVTLTASGCDKFLDVTNPNNLEKENIDPERDANVLGLSVYQRFISDQSTVPVYAAWFTGTAWVGDTFPTRNDVGRRDIPNNNGTYDDFWNFFSRDMQFARTTVQAIEAGGPTLDLARAWFVTGWSILWMSDMFCEGTIAELLDDGTTQARGPMTEGALLDSAIVNFQHAQSVAASVTGGDAAEASDLSMAAQVGIARAHLQAGRASQAASAAASVPDDFTFYLWHLDDPSNRALGNGVWSFSDARISLVVPPELRAIADAGDPRIAYVDMGRVAQDGVLQFYRQDKVKGYGDDDRLASGLEARYIEMEATGTMAEILGFVNERRAVGGLDDMASSDMDEIMTELIRQKTLDFWLEDTKRMADFRRVPQYMTYIVPTGEDTYYKPELGPVREQTCWPVPNDEIDNNPLFN